MAVIIPEEVHKEDQEYTDIKYVAENTAAALHKSEAFFRGLMGPIGSGKSVACVNEIIRISFEVQKPDKNGVRRTRWAVVRNTYPELKSTTIKTWIDWMPEEICPIKWDAPITGFCQVDLEDGTSVEMEVIFLALDKPKDVKKLLSLELTGIWINEAREIPKVVIDAATGRVGRFPAKKDGGPTQKTILADTNPMDDEHWWYLLAEDEAPEDWEKPTNWEFFRQPPALIKNAEGVWRGNPKAENIGNLDGGYKYYMDQLPGKNKEWIGMYVEGTYGSSYDGKPVFPEYSDDLHHSETNTAPVKGISLILGWDFGLTPACIIAQLTPRGRLLVLDELIAERMGIKQFTSLVVKPHLAANYSEFTIGISMGDPAGGQGAQTDEQTCLGVLADEGIYTRPAPTNALIPRREAVAGFLNTMVDGMPAFRLSNRCKTLRKGFLGGYHFRRLQLGGVTDKHVDKPDKNKFSHPHDALQHAAQATAYVDHSEGVSVSNVIQYQAASDAGY